MGQAFILYSLSFRRACGRAGRRPRQAAALFFYSEGSFLHSGMLCRRLFFVAVGFATSKHSNTDSCLLCAVHNDSYLRAVLRPLFVKGRCILRRKRRDGVQRGQADIRQHRRDNHILRRGHRAIRRSLQYSVFWYRYCSVYGALLPVAL